MIIGHLPDTVLKDFQNREQNKYNLEENTMKGINIYFKWLIIFITI